MRMLGQVTLNPHFGLHAQDPGMFQNCCCKQNAGTRFSALKPSTACIIQVLFLPWYLLLSNSRRMPKELDCSDVPYRLFMLYRFVCAIASCLTVVCNTKVPNHVFVRFYYDTIAVGDSFPRIGLEQWKGGKSDQHYLTKKHPNMYRMCFFQHNSPHPAPPSPFCTGEARVQRCAPGVAGLQDLRGVGWLRICCWDVGNDPGN